MMLCELRKRLLHVLAHARRQRKRTKRFDRAAWYDGKIAALEYALSQIEDFGSDKLGLLPEERTAYVPPAFQTLDLAKCGATSSRVMNCTRCGERFPVPVGDSRWIAALAGAFAAVHAGCEERRIETERTHDAPL